MRVQFLPNDVSVEVEDGVTLFEAAMRAGLPVGSSCGADGTCGRCGLRVLDGQLPEASAREIKVAKDNRVDESLRLSCMVVITADVTVTADYW